MKRWMVLGMLSIQLIVSDFGGGRRVWGWPPPAQAPAVSSPAVSAAPSTPTAAASAGIPDEVQLVGTDADPTLRLPVCHIAVRGFGAFAHYNVSYGWLEVDRSNIRYVKVRQSARSKETDEEFKFTRADIPGLRYDSYGELVVFRYQKLLHQLLYVSAAHWGKLDASYSGTPALYTEGADRANSPLILRALQDFDGVLADVKRKQQAAAAASVVPPEPQPVPPLPKPASASPPTLVLTVPSGAGGNRTVEVNESPLTVRGVAVDSSGLPTITINGAPAALRPQTAQAAEFWSDPIPLTPGDNTVEIVATNNSQTKSSCRFVVHFTRKETPVNPQALSRDDIISLLSGGVENGRVTGLVKERGVKFSPTPRDLDAIRAAGGNDELVQAIQTAGGK